MGGSNPHLVPFFRLLCSDVAAAVVAQRRSTGGAAAAAQRQRRSGSGSGSGGAAAAAKVDSYTARSPPITPLSCPKDNGR